VRRRAQTGGPAPAAVRGLVAAAVRQLERVLPRLSAHDLEGAALHHQREGEARAGLTLAVRAVARIERERGLVEPVADVAAEAAAELGQGDRRHDMGSYAPQCAAAARRITNPSARVEIRYREKRTITRLNAQGT